MPVTMMSSSCNPENRMKARAWIIFGLMALIVALPMVMRRQTATTSSRKADDTLVILSPHNESIRQEFGEAFAAHWKESTGRSIYIDWRTPGGPWRYTTAADLRQSGDQ